eukprot:TRINITY_DN1958_c0_g1_i3.p1 TRINITY_DN1958_c0_g1~~TRINITY_DN1958_c0_g1_i3.p1  ORF type:complete len:2140 (+),score=447.96 TRINITY_DN1958_c0_g1_i3:52-6471(+)
MSTQSASAGSNGSPPTITREGITRSNGFAASEKIPRVEILSCVNDYDDYTGEEILNGGTRHGWFVVSPTNSSLTVDLGAPTLLGQITLHCVNVLSSPRTVQLCIRRSVYSTLSSTNLTQDSMADLAEADLDLSADPKAFDDGEWVPAYTFHLPDRNRQALRFPQNVPDALALFVCTLSSPHCLLETANGDAKTKEKAAEYEGDLKHDADPICNRIRVEQHTLRPPACRFWRVCFQSGNGSHYLGVNGIHWRGVVHPVPPPKWEGNNQSIEWSPPKLAPRPQTSLATAKSGDSLSKDLSALSPVILIHSGGLPSSPLNPAVAAPFAIKLKPGTTKWTAPKGLFASTAVYSLQVAYMAPDGVMSIPSPVKTLGNVHGSSEVTDSVDPGISTLSVEETKETKGGAKVKEEQPQQRTARSFSVAKVEMSIEQAQQIAVFSSDSLTPDVVAIGEQIKAKKEHEKKVMKQLRTKPQKQRRPSQAGLAGDDLNDSDSEEEILDPHTQLMTFQSFKDQYEASIRQIIRGHFLDAKDVSDLSTVSIFMSSTFADTTAERNYMMDFGYPDLIEFCRTKGIECNVVDLRWGVSNEFIDDHMAEDVCLQELDRCMQRSLAAAFVFLSSERYGWRNLPRVVDAEELEALLAAIDSRAQGSYSTPDPSELLSVEEYKDAAQTIRDWYAKDENASPPQYILQRMSLMEAKSATVKHPNFYDSRTPEGKVNPGAERVMQTAIWNVIYKTEGVDPNHWMISITEKEVVRGLFERRDGDTEFACLCIMRTIEGLKEARERDDLALQDVQDPQERAAIARKQMSRVYTSPTEQDINLLEHLRERVRQTLPPTSFREVTVPWSEDGITMAKDNEYIRMLCSTFIQDVKLRVVAALERRRQLSDFEKEIYHHVAFALKRASGFLGRKGLKDTLSGLLCLPQRAGLSESAPSKPHSAQNTSSPSGVRSGAAEDGSGGLSGKPVQHAVRVVYGSSGSGKTSLLCAVATTLREHAAHEFGIPGMENACIAIRMCGTSVMSSSAKDVMRSLCLQIDQVYTNTDSSSTLPQSFEGIIEAFHKRLDYATKQQPLFIFIDSLDQLTNQDDARRQPWKWLPRLLPNPYVVLCVSTLPDSRYGILDELRTQLGGGWFVEVPLLSPPEAKPLMQEWLTTRKRSLTAEQWDLVSSSIDDASGGQDGQGITILHLRILFDKVSTWYSYDQFSSLPTTVEDLIDEIYTSLETYYNRGLVAFVMGLLVASRHGLSTENIIDIVSAQDKVLGYKGEKGAVLEYHDPPIRRLPPMVLSRFKAALGDYLVERGANGVTVLSLYHRQFIEAAERRYLADASVRKEMHEALLLYFSGKLAQLHPERNISSQPLYFETSARNSQKTRLVNKQRITELPYALIKAGKVPDLAIMLCDISYIEAKFEAGSSYISELMEEYQRVLLQTSGQIHEAVLEYQLFVMKWAHIISQSPALTLSLAANSPLATKLSASARTIIDTKKAKTPVIVLQNRAERVAPCISTKVVGKPLTCGIWSPDGSHFAVAGNGYCIVYERLSMKQLSCYSGHEGWAYACAFSPNGAQLVSVGLDGLVHLWDANTGEGLHKAKGHWSRVLCCDWSACGKYIASGGRDHAIIIWQAKTMQIHGILEDHSAAVNSCRFAPLNSSPDGAATILASASSDHTVLLWNADNCTKIMRFAEHTLPINCVRWSSMGRYIATASDDRTVVVYKASDGSVVKKFKTHASEVLSVTFGPVLKSKDKSSGSSGQESKKPESDDSTELISSGADHVSYVFSLEESDPLAYLAEHSGWVTSVDWSLPYILSASNDGSAKIWSRHLAPTDSFQIPNPILNLHLSADKKEIHVIHRDHTTCTYSLPRFVQTQRHTIDKVYQDAGGGQLSADGITWVITQYSKSAHIIVKGKTIATVSDTKGANCTSTWHPTNPDIFAIGGHGSDSHIAIYSVKKRSVIFIPVADSWAHHVVWSPNGTHFVVSTDKKTLVWNLQSKLQNVEQNQQAVKLNADRTFPASVRSDLSHDGEYVCLILANGQLGYKAAGTAAAVYQVSNSEKICDLVGQMDHASAIRFSSCGQYVFVVFRNSHSFGCSNVAIYDAQKGGDALAVFCNSTKSNITAISVQREGIVPTVAVGDENGQIYLLEYYNPNAESS